MMEFCYRNQKFGRCRVRCSLDGQRLYVTNSLFSPWDRQFYPSMLEKGSQLLRINVDTEKGSLSIDEAREWPPPACGSSHAGQCACLTCMEEACGDLTVPSRAPHLRRTSLSTSARNRMVRCWLTRCATAAPRLPLMALAHLLMWCIIPVRE